MAAEVKEAFVKRPKLVDGAPGFVRLQVLSPRENPEQILLLTFWEDEPSYQTWYKHHMKESHAGIPKGLKLVPGSTRVSFYDYVCG